MKTKIIPDNNLIAIFLLRLSIGFYLILLGIWGYLEPESSLHTLRNYSHLPIWFLDPYIQLAPYFFFLIGILIILGLTTKIAASVAAMLIIPLLYGAGAFSPDTNKISYFIEKRSLYKDLVILVGCFSLALSDSGAFSLDRIIRAIYSKPE